MYEPAAGSETNAKGQIKMLAVDYEGLLKKFRAKIMEMHRSRIGHGEVESKPTLSLLNEIEIRVLEYTRRLKKKRDEDY